MDCVFVVAVNDRTILNRNFLASPSLGETTGYELRLQENYLSAAKAYNNAIDASTGELMIFLHQDVYLPSGWISRLKTCVDALDRKDPKWGVAGCWGVTQEGKGFGYLYTTGLGVLGSAFDDPKPVQTLDEVVLIMRRSSGLRFDEDLPNFHLYGTHLCMAAAARKRRSYAISAFCVHNSNFLRVLPREFWGCYRYVKRSWRQHLPIHTSCIRISEYDAEMRLCQMNELLKYRAFFRSPICAPRVYDPATLLPHPCGGLH